MKGQIRMSFSELWGIVDETGLERNDEGMCLHGVICGYPVYLHDDPNRREYLLTVFFKTPPTVEADLSDGINRLLERLPKNAVTGRKSELKFQRIKFNASLLYQENSALLAEFVKELCLLADSLGLPPEQPDASVALPLPKEKPKTVKMPKNAVSKKFDKYSIRGLLGAVIGGLAITVLSSMIADSSPSNIGGMLAGWAAGAVIALIVLADYTVFSKKLDIFGTVCCTLITAVSCFFSGYLTILIALTRRMRILDPAVTVNDAMRNWSYYQLLLPKATADFPTVLLKNYIAAIAASVLFYMLYYRRHQAIMYSEGGDIMPDETEKRKKETHRK